MNIKTEINQLKSELDKIEDTRVLKLVREILEFAKMQTQQDWWNELSTKEKIRIQEGIRQADAGELKSYSEVRKKIRRKFKI
ncbi:MAG: hypothetical protein SH857_04430 [Chitinophagales bacterium]|nr:hypothetical protein [Chitinophagales bacterium]